MEEITCRICGTPCEYNRNPGSYNHVCENHEKYEQMWNYEFALKELGMIKELPEKFNSCVICGKPLTDAEKKAIDPNTSINIVCDVHREVEGWYILDIAKDWIRYRTEKNYSGTYKEEAVKFHEWRRSKKA